MSVQQNIAEKCREKLGGGSHQRVSRTVVKTLVYRLMMVTVTIIVAFVVTGNTGVALSIGFATNAVKTVIYYLYERAWNRVDWGR